MKVEHFDVLVVGAGLSGISAAYHLQKYSPNKRFALLEGRQQLGGTWDLFRYPGIRSDSDMHTMGFNFRPWKHDKVIGEGETILNYLRNTAAKFGIDKKIRYDSKVERADWSSAEQKWTVTVRSEAGLSKMTCGFLFLCTGYYNYEHGYEPTFPGAEDFEGEIIHPQKWTKDIDYSGKRVVIIGSGATAITLLPSMTDKAEHVTMLQRSPSYLISWPSSSDIISRFLKFLLPRGLASTAIRWKNALMQTVLYRFARSFPGAAKRLLIKRLRKELPEDFDIERHFTPNYNPWEQRLCLVPDSDFFKAIREEKASVVTDDIDHFTKTGIKLRSGDELPADMIITATGLELQALGGMQLYVDKQPVDPGRSMFYKGILLGDVPNFALTFGYLAASWALKADLASRYVCRLLNYMDQHNYRTALPHLPEGELSDKSFITFSSGYLQRAVDLFPKQGESGPWVTHRTYPRDYLRLRLGSIKDKHLEFRS